MAVVLIENHIGVMAENGGKHLILAQGATQHIMLTLAAELGQAHKGRREPLIDHPAGLHGFLHPFSIAPKLVAQQAAGIHMNLRADDRHGLGGVTGGLHHLYAGISAVGQQPAVNIRPQQQGQCVGRLAGLGQRRHPLGLLPHIIRHLLGQGGGRQHRLIVAVEAVVRANEAIDVGIGFHAHIRPGGGGHQVHLGVDFIG